MILVVQRLSRAEQRDLTRARLLDAAEDVFIERGFHATSVDEVAERAGFSKGAVYSNFESKDELFLAVLDRRVDSRALAIEGKIATNQPLEAQAVEAGAAFFSVFLEQKAWSLLLMEFATYAARHPQLRERFDARNQRIRDAMVDLIDSHLDALGLEVPLPTDQLAAILFALGDGIILEHLTSAQGVPETLFGSALALMLSGIKPKALAASEES
jgi:AcrR family transcriptional regulator